MRSRSRRVAAERALEDTVPCLRLPRTVLRLLLLLVHVMTVDDKLKLLVSTAIQSLFSTNAVTTPIASFDLLARIVASGPSPRGLFPGAGPTPRLRLTDLSRFERILEVLSESWDGGKITLSKEETDGELTVMEVQLGAAREGPTPRAQSTPVGKKRKRRVVDEDDDSAAERAAEEETPERAEAWKPPPSTLESLNKTVKEVYNLMQQATAKGRLLAEQVSASFPSVKHV